MHIANDTPHGQVVDIQETMSAIALEYRAAVAKCGDRQGVIQCATERVITSAREREHQILTVCIIGCLTEGHMIGWLMAWLVGDTSLAGW